MATDAFWQFVSAHQGDDTASLLLAKNWWPDIDVPLAADTIEGRRKMRTKLPSWHACDRIIYPNRLCTEQCSSEDTAMYKAALAKKILGGKKGKIADLTGGLGVDSWAFSTVGDVLYNERDPRLANAAEHNFPALGVNIRVSCASVEPGNVSNIIGDFRPDLVFLDPARRNNLGRKVFRLADCNPDVLALKDELLAGSPNLLLKLSPMADISQVARELGPSVREVAAVSAQGECKELLVWMDRNWTGGYTVTAHMPSGDLTFSPEEEQACRPALCDALPEPGDILLVPDKAVTKAGCFNLLAARYGLRKLGVSTHLYICPEDSPVDGTRYRIQRIVPFSEARIFKGLPADVSARNLPLTSEQLQKKLGIKKSGKPHIWGLRIDLSTGSWANWLLETYPLQEPQTRAYSGL